MPSRRQRGRSVYGATSAVHTRTTIRNSSPDCNVWRTFCQMTGLSHPDSHSVVMLDHGGVINTVSADEACDTGVERDHLDGTVTLMCSYGYGHRQESLDPTNDYYPLVAECAGYIFTDYRTGFHESVDVYRDPWMPLNCIGIRGDKGQAADLLKKPVLLFDDKEENIDRMRIRSRDSTPLSGILVRRGRNSHREVPPSYVCSNDPREWVEICRHFGSRYSSDTADDGPGGRRSR